MAKSTVTHKDDIATLTKDLNARLDRISHLKQNWDSYGAKPVSQEAMSISRLILPDLASRYGTPETLGAPADGGVMAERVYSSGSLELHVETGGRLGYRLEEGVTGELRESDTVSLEFIKSTLSELAGS